MKVKKICGFLVSIFLIGCTTSCSNQDVTPKESDEVQKAYQKYVDDGGNLSIDAWKRMLDVSTVHENGFVYVLNHDKQTYSVGYEGEDKQKSITVPGKFLGREVSGILEHGFENLDFVTRIYLPSTIGYIGDYAFSDCDLITGVYVGDTFYHAIECGEDAKLINSEITIGKNAFLDCASVCTLTIVDGGASNGYFRLSNSNIVDFVDVTASLSAESKYVFDAKVLNGTVKTIEFSVQGKFTNNKFAFVKNGTQVAEFKTNFAISSNVYNIAFLSATYPTTIFSLKAHEITNYGSIPTYVYLDRNKAFDWNKEVYGIKPVPTVSWKKGTTSKYIEGVQFMNDYVADLYRVNTQSFFNFYVTDLSIDMVYKFFVSNRIPESHYKIIMLSDGTASASRMVRNYAVDNPQNVHNQMMRSLAKVKQHIWNTGEFDLNWIKHNLVNYNKSGNQFIDQPSYHFCNHLYTTLCSFENCEWWVNRFRATENLIAVNEKDPVFTANLISKVTNNIYANNLLAALGHDEEVAFKELFHFDDNMFNQSREQGQKIMVILGTSWSGEQANLYDYLKLTMATYGTDYDYYYKPHPGYPTELYKGRSEIIDKLRAEGYTINELDASIAAEIFMYFNKDIYLCGYSSTTYASLDDTNYGMGAMDWGKKLPTDDSEYSNNMFAYTSVLSNSDPLFAELSLDDSKNYYLIQFNNRDDSGKQLRPDSGDQRMVDIYAKHEIAVYCTSDEKVTYYKHDGSSYIIVDKEGNPIV